METDDLGKGWSKFSVVEQETQTFYNRYYYKRVPAKRIVIETPKAKALGAYTLIEKDLRSILIWLNDIKDLLATDKETIGKQGNQKTSHDRARYNLIKGLFVASLTFYGKCFATCAGRKIKLEKSNLSKDFLSTHESIIEARHNFAAHSGASQLERVNVVMALDRKKRKGVEPYVSRELYQPDSYSIEHIEEFILLVNHAKQFADRKVDTLNLKLLEEDILSKPMEYWYKKR